MAMTKEQLMSYKLHLEKLNEEEKKQRDLYLRGLQTGEIAGPMTGYPSIDKPALKYYNMNKYFDILTHETVTEALLRQNADYLNGIALEYFFSKISFKKFFSEVNSLVKSLSKEGIKKGDYISICLAGIPEAMYSIYALGHIGAAGIYLPPYLDKTTMVNDINKNNSKILIVMDMFYEQAKELFDYVIEHTSLEKVVVVPTLNSSILGKLQKSKKYEENNFITYNEFIEQGANEILPPMVPYEKDMPLAVVYSSGSTGILKGVLLSHDSFNNSASSYLAFGFDLSRGQKVYQAIPVWSSTGLIADGASALYYGCTLHQNPQFDPIVYSKNLGMFRDNWGIATTELFNGLIDLKKSKSFNLMRKLGILDYSKLKNVYIGGTFSTPNDRNRLTDTLNSLGCIAKTRASYGTCENGSIVTAELNGIEHPPYSVGVPIPGATVIAIDEEGNELPYGERGELAVKTDCGMLKYYNRPDLDDIFITDREDLKGYKHTGDVGYVLLSGDLIYEGRGKDKSIVGAGQKEIYNFDVKKAILSDPEVFDAEVFTHPSIGKLCANIVFFENSSMTHVINQDIIEEKVRQIQEIIFSKFEDIDYVPELFKIRQSFPMASSTKRDFKKLQAEEDGYIFVNKKHLQITRKR